MIKDRGYISLPTTQSFGETFPGEVLLTCQLRLRCVERLANSLATPCMEALPLSDLSDDLNTLPALSTLNLPSSIRRSWPIVVPKLDEEFVHTNSSAYSAKKPKNYQADSQLSVLTRFPVPRSIGSETSDLLREISVDPTASNAELFHLCETGQF
jgi:hypothetical protein